MEAKQLIKTCIREDKRKYSDRQAEKVQDAADRGDRRSIYKINVMRTNSDSTAVFKDRNGCTLAEISVQLQRWAEHFHSD